MRSKVSVSAKNSGAACGWPVCATVARVRVVCAAKNSLIRRLVDSEFVIPKPASLQFSDEYGDGNIAIDAEKSKSKDYGIT
jgi:hypothetical protein